MPHLHEKVDFTVEAFIVHDGKVLLRMHDKYHMWLGPGGHIEPDEDPCEAAVREAKEEVGLDIVLRGEMPTFPEDGPNHRSVLAPRFMSRHQIDAVHEHVNLYYFASAESDKVIPGDDSDRSDEWKWFTATELSDPQYGVREDVRYYAAEALKAAIIEQW